MPDAKETYLGDGLYASFDGWTITLRAPREHGDHFVCLEPQVYAEFCLYMEKLKSETVKRRKEQTNG